MLCLFFLEFYRILAITHARCRNGVNVEGATHRQVVDTIKHGGDRLTMIVISVPDEEIDRLVFHFQIWNFPISFLHWMSKIWNLFQLLF